MPESEMLLVKRKSLYAVIDAMTVLYEKVDENPLLRAAMAVDTDVRRLALALTVLKGEIGPSEP